MNDRVATPSVADLKARVAACCTTCNQAQTRAQNEHLKIQLVTLAQQIAAMQTNIQHYIDASKPVLDATLQSLSGEATGAASGLDSAQDDPHIFAAMVPAKKLCSDLRVAFPDF